MLGRSQSMAMARRKGPGVARQRILVSLLLALSSFSHSQVRGLELPGFRSMLRSSSSSSSSVSRKWLLALPRIGRFSLRRVLAEEKAVEEFEPCDPVYTDFTPCHDPKRNLQFPRVNLEYRERHCPDPKEILMCLIPPPAGYKSPPQWPQSRDVAWYVNVPYKHLTHEKAVQNWIRYDEATEKFAFPGGGTMFANGAEAYIEDLAELIPLTDGSIRTALDTGCGVASFGAFMLKMNVITMSFAPRDTHEAQVQFALERGLPAMIGVMATKRLPYPARAFDLVHCSRCLIPWGKRSGLYLVEVDRVLRPGGYWVLSGPPVQWKRFHKGWKRDPRELEREMNEIEAVAKNLCWTKVVEKKVFAVWQKPMNHECLTKASQGHHQGARELAAGEEASEEGEAVQPIPLCTIGSDPDVAWDEPLRLCISRIPSSDGSGAAGALHPISGSQSEKDALVPVAWPERLTALPPRVKLDFVPTLNDEKFNATIARWTTRLASYKSVLPPLAQGKYRNILDTNAEVAGFAAALHKDPVWVMNVVPISNPVDTLGLIFERGLIGTYHDWCEAFSSYPRTYDFIHVHALFSVLEGKCPEEVVMLELDRLLRPEGAAIIYDTESTLQTVTAIAKRMRWDARLEGTEGSKFLVCVKKYWTAS